MGLPAGTVLGLQDQSGQSAMGGREAGGQAGRARSHNHDIPVRQIVEVMVVRQFGNFEI